MSPLQCTRRKLSRYYYISIINNVDREISYSKVVCGAWGRGNSDADVFDVHIIQARDVKKLKASLVVVVTRRVQEKKTTARAIAADTGDDS